MSRRLLQVVNGLMGLATVGLGATQMLLGVSSPIYTDARLPASPTLDSNLRFLGGMGLGLGLVLLWLLPSIDRRTGLFRAVWICAFLGGIGRLMSWLVVGTPSAQLAVFAVLEVVGAPALIYWQHRVASARSPVR